MFLPNRFVDRIRTILPPDQFDAVLQAFFEPRRAGFRVNTLRATPGSVLAELADAGLAAVAVAGVPGAFSAPADQRGRLLEAGPATRGEIYVQNASSQVPPLVLAPEPGERVLDLCAAPGSKTRQMACLMGDAGEIVAVEKVRKRFYRLKANLAAQGSAIVRPVLASGAAYWHREPESFDRVLVDAPCSSEGRFNAFNPETTRYWSERKIGEMRSKQQRLLFAGLQALRPGGRLVYSTCSLAPEENEMVVAKALRTFGDAIEVVPIDVALPVESTQESIVCWNGRELAPSAKGALRILPGVEFEGFFVACLSKHESTLR